MTAPGDVDKACSAAADAAPALESLGRDGRARLLDGLADALEAHREVIVKVADQESRLGETRLNGELNRTCYQLRLFGEVLREGSYVEAIIDSPAQTPAGPRPDLRRMLVPLGPVGVFGASNFPLAFSVPGGDTASALAAGCPVVAKAHSAHPETSRTCFAIMRDHIVAQGLPEGVLGLVEGRAAGTELVEHPSITAVGFTGSTAGGRTLFNLASSRPSPIPFYGELGSLNPLIVTPRAAATKATEIAQGYAGSIALGLGQFCTKPGLMFAPFGAQELREQLAAAVQQVPSGVMLSQSIRDAYDAEVARRRTDTRVQALADGQVSGEGERVASAALFGVAAPDLADDLLEELFGPSALVIGYDSVDQVYAALGRLGGQLTATIHAMDDEADLVAELARALRPLAGRLVFGGYPTGLAVAWGTHHGGPYPAATFARHTSVGATAIGRWLRPVSYQNAPEHVLPPELQDDNPAGIPRRVDGVLHPASG